MHAIEFESVVQDRVIPLPQSHQLPPGQSVRVVVMYEELPMTTQPGMGEPSQASAQMSTATGERLAALQPHPDAVPDSSGDATVSSPWDEAAWRRKWERP
ncbi:MAG: hypothetical protein IV089_06750 [Thiobacillus sp.]|nr:hypothetical protein [Thiobacillus sp.]